MATREVTLPIGERYDSEQQQECTPNRLPFSISPFIKNGGSIEFESAEVLEDSELPVKCASEEPYTDLLLELAMATAFASLTDGLPVLTRRALFSYLFYFLLVWWMWISQVAYNLRFRQSDWFHRIWVFLQLIGFCTLAAFTRNFDITTGIIPDNKRPLQNQLLSALGYDEYTLQAMEFRQHRLARTNGRGLAFTMGFSRLLLLGQYILVLGRAHHHHFKLQALLAHTIPILISTVCFFISLHFLGTYDGPAPKSSQIAKVLLWYCPIILELSSYFWADRLPGRIGYPSKGLLSRSASVFIITLGGGIDKITTGFQNMVGNTGLGADGSYVYISAAVIVATQFSLYFGSSGGEWKLSGRRSLFWLFTQFWYLAALILTLQGVATSVLFSNVIHAIQLQVSALKPTLEFIHDHPGVNLTVSDYPQQQLALAKLGISLPEITDKLNTNIALGLQNNDTNLAIGAWLQQSMNLIDVILEEYNVGPQTPSLVWAKLQYFLTATPNDTTRVNLTTWSDICSGMLQPLETPAMWFFPLAGSTLIMLAVLSLIRGTPQCKLEWTSITSRVLVGLGIVSLSALDAGSSEPTFDGNMRLLSSSKIYRLGSNRILLIFALAVGGVQSMELVLAIWAYRVSYSFDGIPFHRRKLRRTLSGDTLYPDYPLVAPQKSFVSAKPRGSTSSYTAVPTSCLAPTEILTHKESSIDTHLPIHMPP